MIPYEWVSFLALPKDYTSCAIFKKSDKECFRKPNIRMKKHNSLRNKG